jgi:two-component system, cell cycle response regulator
MLDLDYFKSFNDTYGHSAGDALLIHLATFLQQNTRAGDVVVRYGGEEFLIVFIDTTAESALQRMESMRIFFSNHPITYNEKPLKCSFSAGIAAYRQPARTAEDLINFSDIALYQAKGEGRNCTRIYSDNQPAA